MDDSNFKKSLPKQEREQEIEQEYDRSIVPWYFRVLLRLWPKTALKILARKQGVAHPIFDKLHEVFAGISRVDLLPLTPPGSRGFILVLDEKTALYFYQDGDHFAYDGFEMGEYEKGDVTIFDRIQPISNSRE